jgi:excisionase family DNA binding protein
LNQLLKGSDGTLSPWWLDRKNRTPTGQTSVRPIKLAELTMKHEAVQIDFRPEPTLWSIQQAAIYLGVSIRAVGNLMARGELVRHKIGSRTLIPKTSLRSFLKRDHETQSK